MIHDGGGHPSGSSCERIRLGFEHVLMKLSFVGSIKGTYFVFPSACMKAAAMIPIWWYLLGVEPLLELQFRLRVIKGLRIRQVWIACFFSLCVCGLKQMQFAPLKQATILFVTWWGKGTCKKMDTLPETNSSHLKMDGWNTIVSFWEFAYFQGWTVSFRECNLLFCFWILKDGSPPKYNRLAEPNR